MSLELEACRWSVVSGILYLESCSWSLVTGVLYLECCSWSLVAGVLWLESPRAGMSGKAVVPKKLRKIMEKLSFLQT